MCVLALKSKEYVQALLISSFIEKEWQNKKAITAWIACKANLLIIIKLEDKNSQVLMNLERCIVHKSCVKFQRF